MLTEWILDRIYFKVMGFKIYYSKEEILYFKSLHIKSNFYLLNRTAPHPDTTNSLLTQSFDLSGSSIGKHIGHTVATKIILYLYETTSKYYQVKFCYL